MVKLATLSPLGVIEKYTQKGSLIDVEGKLRTEKWTDKDGNDRYTTKVRATNIILLSSKNENTQEETQESQSRSQGSTAPVSGSQGNFSSNEEDDLPF